MKTSLKIASHRLHFTGNLADESENELLALKLKFYLWDKIKLKQER
jgi:hypothetical protein